MKSVKAYATLLIIFLSLGLLFATDDRPVNELIYPQWHQTNPWNGRCPGTGQNRAHAGSHALAMAKTLKYWQYPNTGIGNVSYVDDDYGPINQDFSAEINWTGMSNTLVFITTTRFIFMVGASIYTNYEQDYSTSSLTNIQTALINNFNYDPGMQYRNRQDFSNFYWKSLIRQELDNARPVIYTATLSSGTEVAFIVDGYDEAGLFHINWSDVNYPNSWVDLNDLSVWGQTVTTASQRMLTGIQPSSGPADIDENFETDFSNFNWQFSGHANWTISSETMYYGSQAAKSGNINDNQESSMYIQINVSQPDTISFYKRVSCEAETNSLFDHLAFYIDNVEQERWSGDGTWAYHEYPVSPGVHEFRWTYAKDGASVYFSDCAWVDAITFPEGTTPLNPPIFVEAEVTLGNQVNLNWMRPAGINPGLIGYRVYRNGLQQVQYNNPAQTSMIDFNMPNGAYTYYVRALYDEGLSNPSNDAAVYVEVPYAPENLSAILSGVNSALLSWQNPPLLRDRVLMGYSLYRDNVLVAQIENPETNEYLDPNLPEGVYYYELSAMYSAGESPRSNVAQIAIGVPEPPTNFQASVNGSTVNLSWMQVSDPTFLAGFRVFRNGVMVANITNPLQLAYADTNLPNGAYSYFMRAVYTDVESGNSATRNVSVEVPYPPVNVIATVNQDDVQLSWTNPEQVRALTHYLVYRNGLIIAAVYNPNSTTYLDPNLANGQYSYRISAVYSGVESPQSSPANALVEVLYPPRNLSANVNLADVTLRWTVPLSSGGLSRSFNGYNIYRNGTLISFVNGGTTSSYIDRSVANGSYDYAVKAVYSTGESAAATVNGVIVEFLYPVTDISSQVLDDDVILSWSAPDSGPRAASAESRILLHYNVYRNGSLLGQSDQLTYTDAGLVNAVYQYYVTAIYSSGESIPSPTLNVTVEVLYPATNLQAVVDGDNVMLSWIAPVNQGGLNRALLRYRIYRNEALLSTSTLPHYNDNGLANGLYSYQVYAVYSSGTAQPSNTATAVVEVLYPPQNLQYSLTDRNDINLAWEAAPVSQGSRNLQFYRLSRNGSTVLESSALSYADLDLPDGTYSYAVTAVYDGGTSVPSNTVSCFIEYPYPPQGLQAEVAGDDVSISWQMVSGTEVMYHLYRNGVQIAELSGTSFTDGNLANGAYSYYVISSNASESGLSDPSATVNATVDVLYAPRMLQASVNADAVSLSWLVPATGPRSLLSYNVYKDGSLLINTTALVYTDPALANGSYEYYVTAVYDSGESLASNLVTAVVEVLYPATGLTASVNANTVSLAWTAPVNTGGLRSLTGYKVYRNGSEIATSTLPEYSDANLANGSYEYYVTALYSSGASLPSNTVYATVEVLYPPTNLSYSIADDTIILSWDAAATNGGLRTFSSYLLYRDGLLLTETTNLSYSDLDLANGSYSYYVKALYSTGESLASNTVTVNLELLYPATNLSGEVNGDMVSLSWTAATNSGGLRNLQGYKVIRNGQEIAQTANLSYQDAGLANGAYSYAIIASYTSGDANASNLLNLSVEVLYPATELSYTVNSDSVSLLWTAAVSSARDFLGYNVYRNGTLLGLTANTNYLDAGLANGIYQYYVTALYGSGESIPSNTVTATVEVLYSPSQLSYQISDDDVSLSWNAAPNSGGLRNMLLYNIYRDGSLLGTSTELSYTDANLTNGTYNYYVSALYDSGESLPSNTVTANVEVLYPATNLLAAVNGDMVSLNWTAAVNSGGLREFIGYIIIRNGLEIAQTTDVSYQDAGLANGNYAYTVSAAYSTGTSQASNTASVIVEVLYPPTELSYTVEDDAVSLQWTAAANSARSLLSYQVYRDGQLIASTTLTNYTDTALSNGVYQYYTSALYDAGESLLSNFVTATVEVLYPATELSLNLVHDDVTLSWSAAASSGGLRNFLGYNVYRNGSLLSFTTALVYADPNLANGGYEYYVTAVYNSGESLPSNTAQTYVEVLYPATDLTANVNTNTVSLTWTAPVNTGGLRSLTGYKVYRNGSEIATSTLPEYSDANLANGSYEYYVTALYSSGASLPSNTVFATVEVLYPPTNLSYSIADDTIILSWDAAATNGGLRTFSSYLLYRDGLLLTETTNFSYSDPNLANGSYSYYVKALYSTGESLASNTVTVNLELLYPATNLSGEVNGDLVSLSWTAATNSGGLRNLQGYKVIRNGQEIAQTANLSYQDAGLANGAYSYAIIASYTSGDANASNLLSLSVEVLYPATELSYTVNNDSVSLLWTAAVSSARDFLGYNVYRNGTLLGLTANTNYLDAGLANGVYQYYVTAIYGSGESIPSNTVTATVEIAYPATQLSAVVNEDSVTLSWILPAISMPRAFQGYFIYRNGSLYRVLNNPAQVSWTDSGLANGDYSYYLVARYDAALSIASNTVNVNVNVMPILLPPTGFTLQLSGERDVLLSWIAPSNELTGYVVYRNAIQIATTLSPTFTDLSLPNGSYSYYVKAQYPLGLSSPSATLVANIMIADPPSALSALVVNGNSVELSWLAPNQNEIGYQIYRNGTELSYISNPQTLHYTDANLNNGSYVYQIAAVYSSLISNPTSSVTAVIELPYSPRDFALQVLANSIQLNWNAPLDTGGLVSYKLYRNGSLHATVSTLSYTDQNLANGAYTYYVVSSYTNTNSLPSPSLEGLVQIAYNPSGLQATISSDDILLSWIPSSDTGGLVTYNIWRNGIHLTDSALPAYTDANLANGSYSYYVVAQYSFANSAASNVASVNLEVLYPPTALNSSVVASQVNLSWSAPANTGGLRNLLNYNIYRNGLLHGQSTGLTYSDSALNNGNYSYYTTAVYSNGESSASNSVNASVMVLYPPTVLNVSLQNSNDVLLNWMAPNQLETGYKVYRNNQLIATINNPLTIQYLDSDLPNGNHAYKVRASYGTADSQPSNEAQILVMNAFSPQNLGGTTVTNTVNLSWDEPSDMTGFSTYTVLRDNVVIASTGLLTYSDPYLANANYTYNVRAEFGALASELSNAYNATVRVAYPPQTAQRVLTGNDVLISWTAPSDSGFLSGYQVLRNDEILATSTELSYSDMDLPNGTYYYTVKAVFGADVSTATNTGNTHVELFYSPANLALNVSGNTVQLSWDAVSDLGFFSYYKVYRNGIQITESIARTYTDENLANGSYLYSITAVYESGVSDPTATEEAIINLAYPPQNLTYQVTGNDVYLSWEAPQDTQGLSGYGVLCNDVLIASVQDLSYAHMNLNNGSYRYQIVAQYGNQTTANGNEITLELIMPYAPQALAYEISADSVLLNWDAPQDTYGLGNYNVYRNSALIAVLQTTSYTDPNLPNGTYSYSVTANYLEMESEHSSAVTVQIVVSYPAGSAVAESLPGAYKISWEAAPAIANPDRYEVWFMQETQQSDPAQWVFVADTSEDLWIYDTTHGGITEGRIMWAVIARYGEVSSTPVFSNVLELEASEIIPEVTKLIGNYPNPFNPDTKIVFWLKTKSLVKLMIYNQRGQLVKELLNSYQDPGEHEIPWNGTDRNGRSVSSGIYYYKLVARDYSKMEKMVLVK